MQFLVVNQEATANIYGHTYRLQPIDSRGAGLKDVLVADDGSASELLKKHGNILATASFDKEKVEGFPVPLGNTQEIPPGSKVLLLRSGGIGDQIMLTPAIRAFRELRLYDSDTELCLSTQEEMFPIFRDNPFVDRLLPLPLTMDKLLEANYVIDFSEPIHNSNFNRQHPTDYYLDFLGIKSNGMISKLPYLCQNEIEPSPVIQSLKALKDDYRGRPLILIQWQASVQMRTFPPEKLAALTNTFKEFTYIIAHHHAQTEKTDQAIQEESINAINISNEMKNLTDFIDAVGFADGVISTDSSAYHVASAFDKPSLVLFGSIGSNLRACYYPRVVSLDANYSGETCKSPCGLHKGACPEAKALGTTYSPCLMSISEDAIQEQFQKLNDRKTN